MMARRIVASLVAILFVVPLTYLGINSLNPLAGAESGVFSQDRILADKCLEEKNWAQATFHLKKILASDPFNGYAWNCHTYCLKIMRHELRSKLSEAEPDSESRAMLEQQISDLEREVIDPLTKQASFLRFRSRSLMDLAIIYSAQKEWESAMDCLDEYLDGKVLRDSTLSELPGLGIGGRQLVDISDQELTDNFPDIPPSMVGLHRFARFWELVDRESDFRYERGLSRNGPLSK